MKSRKEIMELIQSDKVTYDVLKTFYSELCNNYFKPERIALINNEFIKFPSIENEIAVFPIRLNERLSFNNTEGEFNNDLLFIMQYKGDDNKVNKLFFNVTTDPKSKQLNIAHLVEQIYRGDIGIHRGDSTRLCIRSDYGTWFKRTDTLGNETVEEFGCIGLNIHDNHGAYNSSLGCVILESEQQYINVYKPMLKTVVNKKSIPVCVLNGDIFDCIDFETFKFIKE
jgi:hypothetical protein